MVKKSKKIFFLNPPLEIPKPLVSYPNCLFLNALFNASALKENGFKVELIDSFLFPEPVREYRDFWKFGSGEEKIINEINSKPWDFLIVSYAFFNEIIPFKQTSIYKMLNQIRKKKSQKIILADCHLSSDIYIKYDPIQKLKQQPKLDFVCTRESENKILSVLHGKPIAGVAYRKGGRYFFEESKGENQPLILDFNLIKVKGYLKFLNYLPQRLYFNPKESYFPLLSSRGCNFNCVFCTQERIRGWQSTPLKDIERWMQQLKKENVKTIVFLDLVPNLQPERFEKILDLAIKNNLKLTFPNGMRGDFLTKKLIKKAAKCLDEITISIESGDDFIREKIIKKRLSLGKITEILKEIKKQNLEVYSNFVIGFPGETKKQINTTLEFAWYLFKEYKVIPKVEFLVPISGAPIYQKVKIKKIFHPKFFKEEPYISDKNWTKKELKKFLENFQAKIDVERTPEFNLDLKNPCQNKCNFCFSSSSSFALNKAKKMIKKLAIQGKILRSKIGGREKQLLRLKIKGGDSLSYPNFFSLFKTARNYGFDEITLITKGKLSSAFFSPGLLNKGDLNFSLFLWHWKEGLNDKIAGSPGHWRNVLKGIIRTKKNGRRVEVGSLISPGNFKEIKNLVELLSRLKVDRINLFFCASPKREILEELKRVLNSTKNITVFNLAHCYLPGKEKFLQNYEPVILTESCQGIADLIKGTKKHKDQSCQSCVYNCICSGKFK